MTGQKITPIKIAVDLGVIYSVIYSVILGDCVTVLFTVTSESGPQNQSCLGTSLCRFPSLDYDFVFSVY